MARRPLLILIVGLAVGLSILLLSASSLYSAVTPPAQTPTVSDADLSDRLDLHLRPNGQAEVTANGALLPTATPVPVQTPTKSAGRVIPTPH